MTYNKFIHNQLFKKENIFFAIVIISIFFIDRFSKYIIIKKIDNSEIFFNNYINLDLIWNTGIGFGILSTDSSIIYNLITLLIGIVILYLFYISIISKKIDKLIYCIIIGGALGNIYDRIVFQAVPDFIDIHYKNFHWFTFNFADIFISVGIIAFILKSFFVND